MKFKSNKSQSSVEFLTTYGWILMVIVIAIGILMNYDFFSPSKYLPENADFGEQLKVEEYFLDADSDGTGSNDGVAAIRLKNNFARDIVITAMEAKLSEEQNYNDCNIQDVNVEVSGDTIIACSGLTLSNNVKNNLNIKIIFNRDATGAPNHQISGIIFAQPTEGEYCFMDGTGSDPLHCEDNTLNCDETGPNPDQGGSC